MSTVKLDNINKIYPNGVHAVVDFNLDIKSGEFIVFVGPSGCGKSTTLRMIAGLEEISNGDFFIDDLYMNDKAPKDRDIAMVFQNYALYAHMTVYHNMAFSLMIRKENADFIHERVLWAADILGLTPFLNRRPANLSGGQRQRVAVGRAMVRNPKVFLFDEPLSNLDAKLRGTMRKELKLLHNQLSTTMIYVTHDQIEALTLADRIVVMRDGFIQQVGTPTEVYQDPYNLFVARFIGLPAMNVFDVKISADASVLIDEYEYKLTDKIMIDSLHTYANMSILMGVRPEHFIVSKLSKGDKGLIGEVTNIELLGADTLVYFSIGDRKLIAKEKVREDLKVGDQVLVSFDEQYTYFFGADLSFGKGEGRILPQSLFAGQINEAGNLEIFGKHYNLGRQNLAKGDYLVGLKPEILALEKIKANMDTTTILSAKINAIKPIGLNAVYDILIDDVLVKVNTKQNKDLVVNDSVSVLIDVDKIEIFDAKTRRLV